MSYAPSLARTNPRLRDDLRSISGPELRHAFGGTKKMARGLGISDRWARELASGRADSVVTRFLELVMRAAEPWRLVALVHTTAYRAIMGATVDDLVRGWWAEVEEGISDAGAIITRITTVRRGIDLEALEREATRLARTMEALAARSRELRRREVDPASAPAPGDAR